jgi:dTDP-4-dehydrorhamnose 3,5-epimerase
MSRFTIQETPLVGLKIIQRTAIGDARGFLSRIFCAEELASAGWTWPIAQINHTLTKTSGTVRGMHFQFPPRAEAKLVSCLRGAVWDVAFDIRRGSPTFLKWHAEELSAANQRALLIPPGFAHGFQTLEPDCELLYLHSASYDPACEGALNPRDPALAISWPKEISSISEKDSNRAILEPSFEGMTL